MFFAFKQFAVVYNFQSVLSINKAICDLYVILCSGAIWVPWIKHTIALGTWLNLKLTGFKLKRNKIANHFLLQLCLWSIKSFHHFLWISIQGSYATLYSNSIQSTRDSIFGKFKYTHKNILCRTVKWMLIFLQCCWSLSHQWDESSDAFIYISCSQNFRVLWQLYDDMFQFSMYVVMTIWQWH